MLAARVLAQAAGPGIECGGEFAYIDADWSSKRLRKWKHYGIIMAFQAYRSLPSKEAPRMQQKQKTEQQRQQQRAIAITVAIGIVFILLVILFVSRYACGGVEQGTARIACFRDMAIIIIMFETFVAIMLIAVMVVLVAMLTMTVQEKVVPILASAQDTAKRVETTTNFVSDTVVTPIIRVSEIVSGVQGFLKAVFKRPQHAPAVTKEGPQEGVNEDVKGKEGGNNSNE
jgi:hypothetical protein